MRDADPAGALAGVPLLIKDSEQFASGTAFTVGSRSVRGACATTDHPMMARFRAAELEQAMPWRDRRPPLSVG